VRRFAVLVLSLPPTPFMEKIIWPVMSLERFAALEASTGQSVTRQGDMYWKRIRPFFYRPLVPYLQYDTQTVARTFGKLAVFQHAVQDGQPYNSYLNPIIFENPREYEVRKLQSNAQRCLKSAQKNELQVRRITDEGEFCDKGHDVYLSFYQRSGYHYATYRTRKEGFARWSRGLFQFPELLIFGAYKDDELFGFEVTCLVEGAVILKSIVHSDKGLGLRSPDIVLHHCRSLAREDLNVHMIYDSPMSSAGIDQFKIRRGARVLALPARLHANPFLLLVAKKARKALYRRLLGLNPQEIAASGH
jgi:hypothetical protein